jgi:hypothetical protein
MIVRRAFEDVDGFGRFYRQLILADYQGQQRTCHSVERVLDRT